MKTTESIKYELFEKRSLLPHFQAIALTGAPQKPIFEVCLLKGATTEEKAMIHEIVGSDEEVKFLEAKNPELAMRSGSKTWHRANA